MMCVILGFRLEVAENCALLGFTQRVVDSWTLRIGPTVCSEMSVRNYHYKLR